MSQYCTYYTLAEIIPTCSESCAAYQLFQEATIYGKLSQLLIKILKTT